MSFLQPGFLGALALVGIPILIHLLRRRRFKVVQWAAMEFLLQSQRRQRRKLRIEEIILLLLRCLIIACAALAFARPVLRSLGIPLLSANARVYAVIVLDNSFSMGHKGADGQTSWERSQAALDTLLGKVLKPGDSASLVLLSSKPQESVGAPSFDLALLRQKAKAVQISSRATDYLETAKAVNRLLKNSRVPGKEVYWITDDQASAWESSKRETAKAVWKEMGAQARLTWVSTGAGERERDNLSVGTPTLGAEAVTPQIPARIEALIVNHGNKTYNDLLLDLLVEEKRVASTRINLAPNGTTTAQFLHRFVKAGTFAGRIQIRNPQGADNLERDNSAPFALRVRESLKVLVLDPRPASDPAKSESFYLLTALAPGGDSQSVVPILRTSDSFGGLNLRDFDCVIYVGATQIPESEGRLLAEYVKAGGGVALFPGNETDTTRINATLGAVSLLPAKLGNRRTLGEADALSLNPGAITHPLMLPFKDTSTLDIGTARFNAYYPLELETDNDPSAIQALLRFSNGEPALVERKVGLGRVMIAASGAGTNQNQLPLKSAYPPLLYAIASYLGAGPSARRNLAQEETFSLVLPVSEANKPVKITAPDGSSAVQNSLLEARGTSFVYRATNQSGIYRLSVEGGRTKDAFSVGLPAIESTLTFTKPDTAVQVGIPAGNFAQASNLTQIQASVQRSRYGAEMWRSLLWAILPLLFLESLLAQKFGRRG